MSNCLTVLEITDIDSKFSFLTTRCTKIDFNRCVMRGVEGESSCLTTRHVFENIIVNKRDVLLRVFSVEHGSGTWYFLEVCPRRKLSSWYRLFSVVGDDETYAKSYALTRVLGTKLEVPYITRSTQLDTLIARSWEEPSLSLSSIVRQVSDLTVMLYD